MSHRLHSVFKSLPAVALAAFTAACVSLSQGAPMASKPSSQETSKLLQAHSWDLTAAYDGRGQVTPHTASTMPSSPRLQFDAQRVSLQNLCNVIGASYALKDGRVEIGLPMSTKRACVDRDLMALEQRLSAQLPKAERFDLSGGAPAHLIIHFADGSRWELIGTKT